MNISASYVYFNVKILEIDLLNPNARFLDFISMFCTTNNI